MRGTKIQAKIYVFEKKTKIEMNCHFWFKLVKIGLELSLIFEIETIFLKNNIQN
jgi:hypothetical protein